MGNAGEGEKRNGTVSKHVMNQTQMKFCSRGFSDIGTELAERSVCQLEPIAEGFVTFNGPRDAG